MNCPKCDGETEHIGESVPIGKLLYTPAKCLKCGFKFTKMHFETTVEEMFKAVVKQVYGV